MAHCGVMFNCKLDPELDGQNRNFMRDKEIDKFPLESTLRFSEADAGTTESGGGSVEGRVENPPSLSRCSY
jgi:hypothetical protein